MCNNVAVTDRSKSDVAQLKSSDSYDMETRKVINTITFHDNIDPVGSQKFKAHRYPGDIDLFEPIKVCCSLEQATQAIVKKIQLIASKIKKEPLYFLGDFKAGLDHRFEFDLTQPSKTIIAQIMKLHHQQLLSDEETAQLMDDVENQRMESFNELIRHHLVVRWNLDELIAGVKILPLNKHLSLSEAIRHNTIVKLDLWAPINGNYTEITNFMLLMYLDELGKTHMINIKLSERINSLIHDIKLYSMPQHKKSLKVAKRMWALAYFINDRPTLQRLYPLFSSDAAILSQINNEIETLSQMLTKLPDPPLNVIIKQIDRFKTRMGGVTLPFNENDVFEMIDAIVAMYQKNGDQMDRSVAVVLLTKIAEILASSIEKYASQFMKEQQLFDPNYYDYLLKK